MNKLKLERAEQVIRCLVDGCSVRATVRLTGVAKGTVSRLLVDLGERCAAWHDVNVRGLDCKRVQVDESWAFVGKKAKNVRSGELEPGEIGVGDVWTWTAIDPDSKLIVSWLVGGRDVGWATEFMLDVRDRLKGRVQLTSDGHKPYLTAVDTAFDGEVDYAVLRKIYGEKEYAPGRFGPSSCTGVSRDPVVGDPDERFVSTSHIERVNLTLRMGCRRFTRKTNAHSKKLRNHEAALSLFWVYYNMCRGHSAIKTAPAVAAGLIERPWTLRELMGLLD